MERPGTLGCCLPLLPFYEARWLSVTLIIAGMESVTAAQLSLIGLLQIICLLFLVGLVHKLRNPSALVYIHCGRLAIWGLALGDAITLMFFTAKGPKHGWLHLSLRL